ncbi:MAG: molybdopterin-binding protein [Slackia sp.]|nr:molybdopterin-binding protein [Slackia sp.]
MIATQYCHPGKTITFEGYATDYDKKIVAMEFSMDKGVTWTHCETEGATSDKLVHWRFAYTPELEGVYTLLVRSVNENGIRSPEPDAVTLIVSQDRPEMQLR